MDSGQRILSRTFRKSLSCLERAFGRNWDFGDAASESSKKKKSEAGYWKRELGDLYCIRAESLTTLSSAVTQKAERIPNNPDDPLKGFLSVQGATWFLHAVHSKM